MSHRLLSRPSVGSGLLLRAGVMACLVLVLAAALPGRAAAEDSEVVEAVLRFFRCFITSGPFPFMGVFCSWH